MVSVRLCPQKAIARKGVNAMSRARPFVIAIFVTFLATPDDDAALLVTFGAPPALAQSSDEQKDAFEAAKELGTVDAWEAFLNSYPKGFYADLARAYVRKMGAATSPVPSSTETTQTNTKTTKRLATVSAEPGSTPWRLRSYVLDEGRARTMAATVASDGVELLFHCDGRQHLAGILRKSERGKYPDFDARIRQGLAAKGGDSASGSPALIPMRFSDGTVYSVRANVQEINGEVSLAQDSDGTGFRAAGNLVSDLMTGKLVSIEAPPFSATLQLKNSRKALCSVINRCGAKVSRCASYAKRKTTSKKRRKRKVKRANSPYHDEQGNLLDGYIYDKHGNITQDNAGGE